jgi:hypothetical protein
MAWALATLVAIVFTLWDADWRYGQPTPKPAQVVNLPTNAHVVLPAALLALQRPGEPLLIHFFNPDCPCSRFNREHLQALFEDFGGRVRFVVVAQTEGDEVLDSPLPEQVPVLIDRDARFADALGVYSTPQAVLLDADSRLVYRGNYNVSRYCDDPQTRFVQQALESLRSRGVALADTEPWGCQLPAHIAREGAPR